MQVMAHKLLAFFDTVDVLVLPTYMHSDSSWWSGLTSPQKRPWKGLFVGLLPVHLLMPADSQRSHFLLVLTPTVLPWRSIGRPAAEATLITLAAQLEAAKPGARIAQH